MLLVGSYLCLGFWPLFDTPPADYGHVLRAKAEPRILSGPIELRIITGPIEPRICGQE